MDSTFEFLRVTGNDFLPENNKENKKSLKDATIEEKDSIVQNNNPEQQDSFVEDAGSDEKPPDRKIRWLLSTNDEINNYINEYYENGKLESDLLDLIEEIEYINENSEDGKSSIHFININFKDSIIINIAYCFGQNLADAFINITHKNINTDLQLYIYHKNELSLDKCDLEISLKALGFHHYTDDNLNVFTDLFTCLCKKHNITWKILV